MHLTFATSVKAGVIAWWQMEWPLQGDLADVIAMGLDATLILVLRCYAEPHPTYIYIKELNAGKGIMSM